MSFHNLKYLNIYNIDIRFICIRSPQSKEIKKKTKKDESPGSLRPSEWSIKLINYPPWSNIANNTKLNTF